ncbi:MAG: hypothetical protein ACI84C_002408 [Flavobacteriales bacterium]|jgi:hypothetical protein
MKLALKVQPKNPSSVARTKQGSDNPKSQALGSKRKRSKKTVLSSRNKAALTAVLFCISTIFMGWSMGQLTPLNQRQELLYKEILQLTDSVEKLELSLDPGYSDKIENSYSEAMQSLFDDLRGFPQWQTEVQQKAKELELEVATYPGNVRTQMLAGGSVRIMPLALEITSLSKAQFSKESVFRRVLKLNAHLLDTSRKVEMIDLKVNATTNSIEKVEETLNLWFELAESQ